jgi:epoxyqueuosine reductase QueG
MGLTVTISADFPAWLCDWMRHHEIFLWGAADLRGFETPMDPKGLPYEYALSFALAMAPRIMAAITEGPNQAYAEEYDRVNRRLNRLSQALAGTLVDRGFQALALAASVRSDPIHIKGDFPHKTAATRAGIGWIGRHCQLITRPFGSWVRLGTVFTDCPLPCGPPLERGFCGTCRKCVEACPAQALSGERWRPGVTRRAILDVRCCDQWKKTHYYEFHQGHNCGICSAVCPYGRKSLRRVAGRR